MKGKQFWIGGVVVLLLAGTIGIAYAKQGEVFEGAWYADDNDGSHEWLWITNYYGVYEIVLFDDMCSSCTGIPGEGPSCLGIGSARISEPNTLRWDAGMFYCYWEEGIEPLSPWEGPTVYDPSSDTLSDFGVTWERSNDKKPEKIIDPSFIAKPPPTPRIVFMTRNKISGDFYYSTADSFCQFSADAAGLPGTYKAWLSSFTELSPINTFTHYDVPYELVEGTRIAANWDDLVDGSLEHPINLDQFGDPFVDMELVWTGTQPDGEGTASALDNCDGWTNQGGGAILGNPNETNSTWTWGLDQSCSSLGHFYCFQQ